MHFIDLFAGLGGFHLALARSGHECVFASEIDPELREIYLKNFPTMRGKLFGDIRDSAIKANIPAHEILCAGFPCQPFSKSGAQLGTSDETSGTLFHDILEILEDKTPRFVILENVGNFGRHDNGRTWRIVRGHLEKLGYRVNATEHLTPRSQKDWRDIGTEHDSTARKGQCVVEHSIGETHGLISPHHFGFPHHRERFFIIATTERDRPLTFPKSDRRARTTLDDIVQRSSELTSQDRRETRLSRQQVQCIAHWQSLLSALPRHIELPSFPLWGDEIDAKYPFEGKTPWATRTDVLRRLLGVNARGFASMDVLLKRVPSYAREKKETFRNWKVRFIRQNRQWWRSVRPYLPKRWVQDLRQFPPSLRKLEWNAKGEVRKLRSFVLQFRPSGLRVKRYSSSPALVAMTATQIPVLGPCKRFLTRTEGLRLQGFPDEHLLPLSRDRAFRALGNAVHVGVAQLIAEELLSDGARRSLEQRVRKWGRRATREKGRTWKSRGYS